MQKSLSHFKSNISSRVSPQQCLRRLSKRRFQIASGKPSSPTVFPEKRGKTVSSREHEVNGIHGSPGKAKAQEHRIDIGDEHCDLIGYEVFSGKLALDKRSESVGGETGSGTSDPNIVDAKLTSKALVWGSHKLSLEDVVSVSHNAGLRYFTVHSYPLRKQSCGLSCFSKQRRTRMDYRFLASNSEEAIQWVSSFADQQCFVNCLPHPMPSSQEQASNMAASNPLYDLPHFKSKTTPKVLVILNPRSGHGRSSKVFHGKVEPIFELAGFKMKVVKTTSAGHARTLSSTVDFETCPDGIICVGGDGIVNEVLNGLLSRDDQKEAISIPIGIIPAGSDNSLVWTVLGVRDPISAAMTIVKGGLTAIDVLAVEWIQTRAIHFGMTVSYFGFLGDVLELSEKYQKHFGPLRYFVAGFLKFLFLPKYSFELEYLPIPKEEPDKGRALDEKDKLDLPDLYADIIQRSHREGIPRASSLSSIDSIMTPGRMSPGDLDTAGSTLANIEPSEYFRGLEPNSKHLPSGRSNLTTEQEEVLHPQSQLSPNLDWPRIRPKSWADKGWTGLNETNVSRCSWADTAPNGKDDISSTLSDPGPIWDSEPKWDTEPNWDTEPPNWEVENHTHLPETRADIELGITKELVPRLEEKWVVKKGHFLGVLVCNHSCRTVQSLSSQVVAPAAEHDDNSLDLLLVRGKGRLRLLRFFICLQFGCHLSLPYVEYIKVKSVRMRPTKNTHNGCGIDGELLRVNGQVICSLLPDQGRLIGHPTRDRA